MSTLAILAPVQAHFTLGLSQPNYPFTVNNFDPHASGVIGYVWPGGGENTYVGTPTFVGGIYQIPPGYIAPYPTPSLTNDAALGGLAGSYLANQNYLQLDAHEYAPFGAIVTGTTGDLIFAFNATADWAARPITFSRTYILIPPDFGIPDGSQVVTTITNNYADIITYSSLSTFDRYAPGWHVIRIDSDPTNPVQFNGAGHDEWYYVRINGVTAPVTAGKYFFKMFFRHGSDGSYWVPTQNWPVLLVKGELDPAIITGTIRYGGYNSTLYNEPMREAGMVEAVMKTKLDPYTGAQLSGPLTNAVGYFNATAQGHYEIEGVAPGIYDLYAEAAGYPNALIASNVQVLKGQSLHFDGLLNPGPVIHGDVFSKHAFGSEPWPETSYIKIELYDAPTVNHVPDSKANLVSWSPLPCIAGGQTGYSPGEDAATCGDPRQASTIAFPYFDWTPGGAGGVFYGATPSTDPQGVGPYQNWYVLMGEDSFHFEFGSKGEFGAPRDLSGMVPQLYATWINGLTPGRYYARAWVFRYVQSALDGATFQEYSFPVGAQEWAGDITLPIDLRISSWIIKDVHFHNTPGTLSTDPIDTGASVLVGGLYDASSGIMYSYNQTDLTAAMKTAGESVVYFYGLNDTWLGQNYGIPAGTYKPKVAALGYVQQTQDLVSITLSGTPIVISNHLYRGVGFNFTVYSIDWEQPRVNRNWVWPGQDIGIGIFSEPGHVYTNDACFWCDLTPGLYGFGAINTNPFQEAGTYYEELNGTGTNAYNPLGYGGSAAGVFFGHEVAGNDGGHMIGLDGSIACYYCSNGAYIGGRMSNTGGMFTTGHATTAWKLTYFWPDFIDSGQYSFQGWTYGYIQDKDFSVYATKGQIADIKVNLMIGVNVSIDVLFKKEHLLFPTLYNMSARVRVFDDSGNLVGEWMSAEGVYLAADASGRVTATGADFTPAHPATTSPITYLPAGVSQLHVLIAGLPLDDEFWGYGDPIFTGPGSDFELDTWPFSYWSTAPMPINGFPNEGILGQPDYTGTGWTVEVDFVNWYYASPLTLGTANAPVILDPFTGAATNFYPVVPGLLMGESYHIIPGTLATSGISFTEDGALNSAFLGHSMAPNHLGPYSQEGTWSLAPAHLSGETSGEWEVDLNGYLSGTALAFTWSNELRTLSWYTVSVVGTANGSLPMLSYTNDGTYEFYLLPGQYSMTISGPGYATTPMGTISVTSGQMSTPGTGVHIGLPPTNIPVPEFSGLAIALFSALAASLYLLRRRRQ